MDTITNKKITKTLCLDRGTPDAKREEIRSYFHSTFDLDEQLFESFRNKEAFFKRADPLRHPLIFYYGHTATFWINKLNLAKLTEERINPEFESMFAVGVDEMSWDDLNDKNYDWPSVDEVALYRSKVRNFVDQIISELPMSLPIQWDNPFWVIVMCIEHMRIHFETSSVLLRHLPLQDLKPISDWTICNESFPAPENELVNVSGGSISCGKDTKSPLYGWDNEYGSHSVKVEDFSASKYLCSNREFLQFVEMGGYGIQKYWTEEGWNWCRYEKAQHPRFWKKTDSGWNLRLMTDEIVMPWDWPAEVNYLEAKAFCNWLSETTKKTIRLPLEEEWIFLNKKYDIPDQPEWDSAPGNINMEHYQSPCPVTLFQTGPFFDLIGNVWQWTETPISGYKGFKVHPYYDDFSVPTFDNRHNIIKGGSWISTGNEATKECRYAFRRHFYQHAGFRYVESEIKLNVESNLTETDSQVCQNLQEDWGEKPITMVRFRSWLANYCIQNIPNLKEKRVLDLGCETGRSSFELAHASKEVMGLDFTARNIQRAVELLETGECSYEFKEEGDLVDHNQIHIEALGLTPQRDTVSFYQADPSNLKPLYSGYDVVIVNDSLRSMTNPNRFLSSISEKVAPEGYLIMACSYDWDSDRNQAQCRPGGFRKDGEPYRGSEGVEEKLSADFDIFTPKTEVIRYRPTNKFRCELQNIEVCIWKRRE